MIEADKKETIIVGYAFLEDESEEERAAYRDAWKKHLVQIICFI